MRHLLSLQLRTYKENHNQIQSYLSLTTFQFKNYPEMVTEENKESNFSAVRVRLLMGNYDDFIDKQKPIMKIPSVLQNLATTMIYISKYRFIMVVNLSSTKHECSSRSKNGLTCLKTTVTSHAQKLNSTI
jgi:hypothetical protein